MRKSGFLRRVAALFLFVWVYRRFVLEPGRFIHDPASCELLEYFLYAAVVFGIVTMLADRLRDDRDGSTRDGDDD